MLLQALGPFLTAEASAETSDGQQVSLLIQELHLLGLKQASVRSDFTGSLKQRKASRCEARPLTAGGSVPIPGLPTVPEAACLWLGYLGAALVGSQGIRGHHWPSSFPIQS